MSGVSVDGDAIYPLLILVFMVCMPFLRVGREAPKIGGIPFAAVTKPPRHPTSDSHDRVTCTVLCVTVSNHEKPSRHQIRSTSQILLRR